MSATSFESISYSVRLCVARSTVMGICQSLKKRDEQQRWLSRSFFYNLIALVSRSNLNYIVMKCFFRQYADKWCFKRKIISILSLSFLYVFEIGAITVDYSVTSVPEETGLELMKISQESDYVCMPSVIRNKYGADWFTNRILAISPNGEDIAFLSARNNATNIFIKDVNKQGASRQRTNRSAVIDFSYSPDGEKICFSESKGKTNQIFLTDAHNGYICRQITQGAQDYSPVFDNDMKNILFVRLENKNAGVWGYDVNQNFLSSYTNGLGPVPSYESNAIFVSRSNAEGRGEIWHINFDTGAEECLLSDTQRSFHSPLLSPDKSKLLLVGSSKIENGNIVYWNTDLFIMNIDGTNLHQLTYHAADDVSPIWSSDGKFVYFISQRGSKDAVSNIWRLTVPIDL